MDEEKFTYLRSKSLDEQATAHELIMARLLNVAGYEFATNYPVKVSAGFSYYVDFYLFGENKYIEVDGSYHFKPEQKEYDKRRRDQIAEATGWTEIRFTNKQVQNLKVNELRDAINNNFKKKKRSKFKKYKPKGGKRNLTLKDKVRLEKDKWAAMIKLYPDPNIIRKH